MFSSRHSFSELAFLRFPMTKFDSVINEVKEYIEYFLSAHYLANDRRVLDILLSSSDSKLPLSLIHDIIEEFDFSFSELLDILEVTPIDNVQILSNTHFFLNFRLHTVYWAIVLNLGTILRRHSSRESSHPWIDLRILVTDSDIVTTNIELITKALSSGVPCNIEPRVDEEGLLFVRITPNMDMYENKLDQSRVDSPFDYRATNRKARDCKPEPPDRLYKDSIHNAYNPSTFIPRQLHIHKDSLLVSLREINKLFPNIKKFRMNEGDHLTVSNHDIDITPKFLVQLKCTEVRVLFAGIVLDAKFSVYDSTRYDLIWSQDSGYQLRCNLQDSIHSDCVCHTDDFLDDFILL